MERKQSVGGLADRMDFSMCIEDVSPPTSLRVVEESTRRRRSSNSAVAFKTAQQAATDSLIDDLESSVLAVPVTPTRSVSDDDQDAVSNSSSLTSSNSSSSLAAISQSLKREHHKLVAEQQHKIEEDTETRLPHRQHSDNESSFILTHSTKPISSNKSINHSSSKLPSNSHAAATAAAAMLSKSPNFNSFYFYNENESDKQIKPSSSFEEASNTPVGSSSSGARDTLLEMDSVKHKLSNLWNNVKYGWVNYMKKPSYKLDTDSDLPIYILGKKFYPSMNTSAYGLPDEYYFDHSAAILSATPNMMLSTSYSIVQAEHHNRGGGGGGGSDSLPTQLQQQNQQQHTMMNSFLSVSPPIGSMLPTSSTNRQQQPHFLNRLLSENLIKTPLEQEIYSRLWFTYRKDFEPLRTNSSSSSSSSNKYTSDCGWGCMLRSAQMLIAQALLQHLFSKDWSLFRSVISKQDQELYRDLISLFNDRPAGSECPFGLHNLLEIADDDENKHTNKKKASNNNGGASRVGTWFGPTAVCFLVRDALNRYLKNTTSARGGDSSSLLNNVRIYVAQDCTIFKKDVLKLCMRQSSQPDNNNSDNKSTSTSGEFVPCVILVSVRLGGDSINPIYYEQLKKFFQMDICIGMIGGKPKHSLYFIGYQGDKVIYLDPHLCQPAVNVYSSKSAAESRKKQQQQSSAGILIPNSNKSNSLTRSPQIPVGGVGISRRNEQRTGTLSFLLNSGLSSSSASSLSSINSTDCDLFDNSSFHCASPSKTSFAKLDPSLAVGFYCRTLGDFQFLCDTVQQMDSTCSIFGVSESSFEQTQLDYEQFNLEERSTAAAAASNHHHQPHLLDESKNNNAKSSVIKVPPPYQKSLSSQKLATNGDSGSGNSTTPSSTTTPVKSSHKNMKSFLVIPPTLSTTNNHGHSSTSSNNGGGFQTSRFKSLTSLASSNKPSTTSSKKSGGKKGADPDDFVLV